MPAAFEFSQTADMTLMLTTRLAARSRDTPCRERHPGYRPTRRATVPKSQGADRCAGLAGGHHALIDEGSQRRCFGGGRTPPACSGTDSCHTGQNRNQANALGVGQAGRLAPNFDGQPFCGKGASRFDEFGVVGCPVTA